MPPPAITTLATVVILPLASIVICGTVISSPYVPGTTPVALSVVVNGVPVLPVPVTSPVSVIELAGSPVRNLPLPRKNGAATLAELTGKYAATLALEYCPT